MVMVNRRRLTRALAAGALIAAGSVRLTSTGLAAGAGAVGVRDASIGEGPTGARSLLFPVTLAAPAPAGGVTVTVAFTGGTATATDFQAGAKTVTIAAGKTSATAAVKVLGDAVAEPDETMTATI